MNSYIFLDKTINIKNSAELTSDEIIEILKDQIAKRTKYGAELS